MSLNMQMGLALMGYGLVGVFATLGLFIAVIKLLVWLFPAGLEREDG